MDIGRSMMIGPAFNALTADMTPKEKRGRILGIIGNLNILTMVLASFISGLLYQIDSSLLFYFMILTGSVILILTISLISEPAKREM